MSDTKKKTAKKKKPLRLAQNWFANAPRMALKMFGFLIVIAALGMMFSSLQAIGSLPLRMAIAAVVVFAMLAMIYSDGLTHGTNDAAASRAYMQMKSEGREVTAKDDAACYHPLKALCASLLAVSVPMLLAIYVALNAKDYTYTLQSLPAWMTGTFSARSDLMAPLAAYHQASGMVLADWLRVVVRLFEMVFINLFPDPQKMTGLIDRVSPAILCAYPIVYMIGYLMGPATHEKQSKQNRRAKKVAVRRAERTRVAGELLGAQNQVHYGHQKEEKARKKKDLV